MLLILKNNNHIQPYLYLYTLFGNITIKSLVLFQMYACDLGFNNLGIIQIKDTPQLSTGYKLTYLFFNKKYSYFRL